MQKKLIMKIALVSCSKLKQSYSCLAEEMYSKSSLFKKATSFVKNNYTRWFILSAKYGLLQPEDIIDPYNISLNKFEKNELILWSDSVFIKILDLYPTEIDFYAGNNYRKYLIPKLQDKGIVCSVPLTGMGIGEQLRFYNEQWKNN